MEPREEDLVAQPEEEEAPQAEKTGDKAEATDDKVPFWRVAIGCVVRQANT